MTEQIRYLLFSQHLLEYLAAYVLHHSLEDKPENDSYYFRSLYPFLSHQPSTKEAAEILKLVEELGGTVSIFALNVMDVPETYELWAKPCTAQEIQGRPLVTMLYSQPH